MSVGLHVISTDGIEPVTLNEAKLHLRVDGSDEDGLIGTLIQAARQHAEGFLGLALVPSTYEWSFDSWPQAPRLTLPYPPLTEVESITITDERGLSTVWSHAKYFVVTEVSTGFITPIIGETWPTIPLAPRGRAVIRFKAGFPSGTLPAPIRQALLLLIGHWYAHREAVTGSAVKELPMAVNALLAPYRMFRWRL